MQRQAASRRLRYTISHATTTGATVWKILGHWTSFVTVRILTVVLRPSFRLSFILLRGLSLPRRVNLTLSRSHHVERQCAFLVKVPTGVRRCLAVSHLNITLPALDFVRHIVFWVHVADGEGGVAEPDRIQGDELLFAQFRQMLLDRLDRRALWR